jgi:hypothetical protein
MLSQLFKNRNGSKLRAVLLLRCDKRFKTLGAQVAGDVVIPEAVDRVVKAYDGDVFEPEATINAYLTQQRERSDKDVARHPSDWEGASFTGQSAHGLGQAFRR